MEINATIFGQLITFAILVWFVMKYVWPPINKAMTEREKKIAAGLEATERAQRELNQAEHKALGLINDAKREAQQLIELAHKRAEQMLEEEKSVASDESARLIANAKSEIAREVNQAKDMLRKQLSVLAVAAAEKIIKNNLDVSKQSALLDEFLAEI